jgi:hypothetical protein
MSGNKRIIDCFRFFNEKELLELRYYIYKDIVDKFIILESDKTFSGNLREEFLAKKYIQELNLPKDKFIVIETILPSNDDNIENTEEDIEFRNLSGLSNDTYKNSLNARTRERLQLNSLLDIIDQFNEEDVFLVSDCDEIVNPDFLVYASTIVPNYPDSLLKTPLVNLEGSANLRSYNKHTNQPLLWDKYAYICTKLHISKYSPTSLRYNLSKSLPIIYVTENNIRVEDCGWHFTWMGDNDRLKLKIKSTAHYADKIKSSFFDSMDSKEVDEFIDNWTPEINGANPWGNSDIILKEYSIDNLPKEIFQYKHLTDFFLPNTNKSNISSKILDIVNKYDINSHLKEGGTDKFDTHAYLDIYSEILQPYINKEGSLLELGVFRGGSVLLWSTLLEKFKIVGVDIYDLISSKVRDKVKQNVELIFTDAYNQQAANLLSQKYSEGFDIIIDDGPHNEQSQIECINLYFPLLKNNGFLIIEDIQNFDTVDKLRGVLNQFNSLYNYEVKVYDYRYKKNQYDDIVFSVKKINKKSIPVIGTAIVNTTFWLSRLIESVDYPVDEFVIINNNGRGEITEQLDAISKIEHKFIKKIKVCHLPHNIGCSGAWNLIIKSYMLAPYWVIVNHDVKFSPGILEEFQKNSSDKQYGTIHAGEHKGLGMFDMFLLKDWAVQKCGLFDENLYPAYAEDMDYIMRLCNSNIKSKVLNMPYAHGDVNYETTGSQTWRSDLTLKDKLSHSLWLNEWEYLTEKWGPNWRMLQQYKAPFNNESFDNKYTKYDLDFVRRKHLGF